ncbi:MAG TPA: hypothetical protein VHR84_08705 [Terriglobales bacterium]|jgi:hypothetical protein|nr:hypothetical protein [Terriglobales bacterium]
MKVLQSILLVVAVALVATMSWAAGDVHAVAGAITKVDKATKTFVLKAMDGTEHVFKYSEKTAVHDARSAEKEAKKGVLDSYMAGKEGTHAVVHYTGDGADKTAVQVDDYGKDALKTSEGTVTKVDKTAHTISIKTKDGAEETFHYSRDVAVETEHGVMKDTKEGEKVTVHYTEKEGKKIAELFRRL